MTILDTNILSYSHDSASPHHEAIRAWLDAVLRGNEVIGLPWQTIWAFLRIRSNSRIVMNPRPVEEALTIIRQWLALPGVMIVAPGPRHFELLARLALEYGVAGPAMTNATLVALAIEHGATLASADRDFSRFPDLRWVNPLA